MQPPDLDSTQSDQPAPRLDEFQPIPIQRPSRKPSRRGRGWVLLLVLLGMYFFFPARTNILLLGEDYLPPRDAISRTDTMMLATIVPLRPYVGLLSIPRDLWVSIPGVGENRINTAYFFAEAQQRDAGPEAAMQTVRHNFGLTLRYYVVIRMEGVMQVIDALGGVDIQLEAAMGGLPAGAHHLDGPAALAFARERYTGDDFARMAQGQLLLRALLSKARQPSSWPQLPLAIQAVSHSFDTNVPLWLWPRLGLAFLRAGPRGVDGRVIGREMVTPFQTEGGAQVLAPEWGAINPMLLEMFGE